MKKQVLTRTTSLCSRCKRSVPAETYVSEGQVRMAKRCEDHGMQEVLIETDADWYRKILEFAAMPTPPKALRDVAQGCPFDCGPCTAHEQSVQLPIVPITSSCNLDCPICYTHNKNADAFHMSEAALGNILEHLRRAAPDKRIINITGGEPTQHPDLIRLLELCAEEGIHRITLSTHGLGLAANDDLLRCMAKLDVRVILSFDSFRDDTNDRMLGGRFSNAKMRTIETLGKHGISTTLLPVLAKGVNHDEIGAFIDLVQREPFIRSIEFHTMTFTGQGGVDFSRAGRYTPGAVLLDIEAQTGGQIRRADFVPSPLAHPLCYLVTYLLRLDDGRWLPFTRFMEHAVLRNLLSSSLYLEPGPELERTFQDVINRLWSQETDCEDADAVLRALKGLIHAIFAPGLSQLERMRMAESRTKAVYLHSHMDEETFDTDRIRLCPVGIREPDGRNIPSCAYNVLYRERDARFMKQPKAQLVTLGRGA